MPWVWFGVLVAATWCSCFDTHQTSEECIFLISFMAFFFFRWNNIPGSSDTCLQLNFLSISPLPAAVVCELVWSCTVPNPQIGDQRCDCFSGAPSLMPAAPGDFSPKNCLQGWLMAEVGLLLLVTSFWQKPLVFSLFAHLLVGLEWFI